VHVYNIYKYIYIEGACSKNFLLIGMHNQKSLEAAALKHSGATGSTSGH